MPSYHHDRNPIFDKSHLAKAYQEASTRAKALEQRHAKNESDGNPSTGIWRLAVDIQTP
jgi:hypothetical protein